jgi:hypothetical protein
MGVSLLDLSVGKMADRFRLLVSGALFQMTDVRGQMSEDRCQKTDDRRQTNVFCHFKKSLSEAIPSFDIRHSAVLRFAF